NYYSLIFSNKRSDRFMRHFLFWLAVFFYHFIRISFFYPAAHLFENIKPVFIGALVWGTIFNMIFSYTIVYYLVPRLYIKKKYTLFAAGVLLLFTIMFFLGILQAMLNRHLAVAIGTISPISFFKATAIRVFGNPPLICGVLLSLKKIKDWHLKQNENKILARENTNAELQLLKAQIHPHFLFNTLNNIYFFILSEPVKAEDLVAKLENLLYYMINECTAITVPLDKEINMINDYFELEKVRYGERLDVELNITGDYDNKTIAPLLMIPFIENSFKHGTSKVLREPWIKLFLQIDTDMLHFTLANNKPTDTGEIRNSGIGLNNVKKRLAILHPKNHYLNIEPTPNSFTVNMQIPLG
ncbi:MAG: sensor histidine kinase, partial [Ginsengibacter sp.]